MRRYSKGKAFVIQVRERCLKGVEREKIEADIGLIEEGTIKEQENRVFGKE
jgi:hypothetical protein